MVEGMTQKQSEAEILAAMEADLATTTIADQVARSAPWLDARPAPERTIFHRIAEDSDGGGFPPVEPPEPTYGGRRPGDGRRAPRDIPLWLAISLIWAAVAAAWAIDTVQQRMIDKPLVILVGVGGTLGLLGLEVSHRRGGTH